MLNLQIKAVTPTQTEEFVRVPFFILCCFSYTSTIYPSSQFPAKRLLLLMTLVSLYATMKRIAFGIEFMVPLPS
jgi:hypothetical protein